MNNQSKKFNIKREVYELLDSVILSAVCVLVVFTLLFKVFVVNGPSMQPTLQNGDRLIVSDLFYTPKNGDIVCFYNDYKDEILVKRVIATEGQTVNIDENNCVYVDGVKLDEKYIHGAITHKHSFKLPYTVSDNCIFVMGDNRGDSMDSRYSEIGSVKTSDVLGRLIVRLHPNFGKVE